MLAFELGLEHGHDDAGHPLVGGGGGAPASATITPCRFGMTGRRPDMLWVRLGMGMRLDLSMGTKQRAGPRRLSRRLGPRSELDAGGT